MTDFTEGEWRFIRHGEDSYYLGNIQASLGVDENGIQEIRTITCQLKYGSPKENEANAHLIAAAPDMFYALEECATTLAFLARHLEGRVADGAITEMQMKADEALEVLAKARGESQ